MHLQISLPPPSPPPPPPQLYVIQQEPPPPPAQLYVIQQEPMPTKLTTLDPGQRPVQIVTEVELGIGAAHVEAQENEGISHRPPQGPTQLVGP